MFIHIGKIVEHASNWLKLEGHAAESEVAQAVQKVVNYIGAASEVEHAAEVLKKAGFTVLPPNGPVAEHNTSVLPPAPPVPPPPLPDEPAVPVSMLHEGSDGLIR